LKTTPKKTPHFGNGLPAMDRPMTFHDVEEIKIEKFNEQFIAVYVYRSMALKTTPNVFNKPRADSIDFYGVKKYLMF